MSAAMQALDEMVDRIFTPPHLFFVVEQDGTEAHREPTVGERYEITWTYSGETYPPCVYLGRGKFRFADTENLRRPEYADPFPVEPREVECLEELQ